MKFSDTPIAVVGGVVPICAALLVLLAVHARRHPETARFKGTLRLMPDLPALLRRPTADRTLPGGIRVRVLLLLSYLASSLDLLPDFLPVIGYADDAILVAVVLRSVIRRARQAPLERQWPGTPFDQTLVQRLADTTPPQSWAGSESPVPAARATRNRWRLGCTALDSRALDGSVRFGVDSTPHVFSFENGRWFRVCIDLTMGGLHVHRFSEATPRPWQAHLSWK